MMSAKIPTPGLPTYTKNTYLPKGYDTNKILSRDSSYIVDVVM